MAKISAVINVIPEEVAYLTRLLPSIVGLVDEIVLIDMTDGDENLKAISDKYEAKIYTHSFQPYVEAVRNFGLNKAIGEWILILDPDEEFPKTLVAKLKKELENPSADYYRLPRKNIVFGKWMQHSRWWPDYNIRLFRRGHVMWEEIIHSIPVTKGKGADLPTKEEYAITHYHYTNVDQYISRMHRYSSVQAKHVASDPKYKFIWMDIIRKPTSEFLSRYFAGEGYKDGLHGLAMASLQAFSELVLYLKVWEREKFMEQHITPTEVAKEFGQSQFETNWWITDMLIKDVGIIKSLPLRLKRKILKKRV